MGPIALIRGLPPAVRVLIIGTFVNKVGSFITPYLTLVLWRNFHLSAQAVGLMTMAYGFGSIVSVLSGGYLTDRLGRRRTLLISLLGSGALAVGLAAAPSVVVFVPLLVLFGFLADLYRPAASAIIGDLLPSAQRLVGFAALRMAVNLGFAAGMVAGGLLADWSWRALFAGDGLTTFCFGLIVLASLPETAVGVRRSSARTTAVPAVDAVPTSALWHDRPLIELCTASLLFKLAFYSAFSVLPLTITQWAGYPTVVFGLLVGLNGLIVAFGEVWLVHRLQDRRRLRLAALGTLLSGFSLAASGLVPHWAAFLVTVIGWTLGEMLSVPQELAFLADWAPPAARGRYLSAFQATWSVALAINPLTMLPLYLVVGPRLFWPLVLVFDVPAMMMLLRLDRTADRPELLRGRA